MQPAKFFCFRNGMDACEMKNRLPAVILAQPAGFHGHATRLSYAATVPKETFRQFCESFRKIGQEFGSNFALIAARPQNARNQQPAWRFKAQW